MDDPTNSLAALANDHEFLLMMARYADGLVSEAQVRNGTGFPSRSGPTSAKMMSSPRQSSSRNRKGSAAALPLESERSRSLQRPPPCSAGS